MILPDILAPLQALGAATAKAAPGKVLGLVHMRASQLNGCAFCLELHARMPNKHDETQERLLTVAAWRDSPFFTDAERAALALTEAATRLDPWGVPDDVWAEAERHFDEATLAAIVVHIALVNMFNRMNVTTKQVAGSIKFG
jgi:AhpD family alkylhydroperoxidase